jgi:hypothetical protein
MKASVQKRVIHRKEEPKMTTLLRPDKTFYPSPQMACKAPAERLGYVATLNYGRNERPDGISVVDLDTASPRYGQVIYTLGNALRG